ncbi:proline iminopeptidase [Burkholderiales bacterium]|nr:MAG: prolyl aminopeptidase [Burkholderiales bacterium]CAG0963706.1 proline iminopeptidase [Burkholderiales bacterium]
MRPLEENRDYLAALYPPIEPYEKGRLVVDQRHSVYWETAGNPLGVPVVFLHGGPGSGCTTNHRRFFDPAFYRIVLLDQRGAGRSTPHADLQDNSTQNLVADLEQLRMRLGIEKWILFGGSWGSTLALAYAIEHPDRCLGMVLRGVFLGRASEVEWFMRGMRQFFPEAWADFAGFIPLGERGDLLRAYYNRLTSPNAALRLAAAQAWSQYEARCCTLLPSDEAMNHSEDQALALSLGRIEAHYFVNRLFLEEGELLARVGGIRHLPGYIVQGRYDVVCPPVSAFELQAAWPEAELVIVPDAGHAAWEPGTTRALVQAMENMKTRV